MTIKGAPQNLRCESLIEPLAVWESRPRLSWLPDRKQTAYRIIADGLWDSGKVRSGRPWADWGGAPLPSRTEVNWRVMVWRPDPSAWAGSRFTRGLDHEDWIGEWIGLDADEPEQPIRLLRRSFAVAALPHSALLHLTALGVVHPYVNGLVAGDDRLTPGWTDFRKRVYSRTWQIAKLLNPGENSVTLALADGWYAGYIGPNRMRAHYGCQPRTKAQLEFDGTVLATDSKWEAAIGYATRSDFYDGEDWGPKTERPWTKPNIGAEHDPLIQPHPGPSVFECEEIPPAKVAGDVYDFGTYITGHVRASSRSCVTVSYAEAICDGEPYFENLRGARCEDRTGPHASRVQDPAGPHASRVQTTPELRPLFAHRGFRYASVIGNKPDKVSAVRIAADMPQILDGSHKHKRIVNALINTIRATWLDIPTDCPQRDERLGWTGDANLVAPAALMVLDCRSLLRKWLVDLFDAQMPDGALPAVAPSVVVDVEGGPGWSDAAVNVPLALYRADGDARHLERHFESIERWIERELRRCLPGPLPPRKFHCFGDWLNINQETPHEVIYMCSLAQSLAGFAEICRALGRPAPKQKVEELKRSFAENLVTRGEIEGDSQTGYAMALRSGILTGHNKRSARDRLVAKVESEGLRTGFLGTRDLLPALDEAGRADLAERLLSSNGCPGWLHMIEHGPGTLWERWDGWTKERGFADPEMNSFCHAAFGSVVEWIVGSHIGFRYNGPQRLLTFVPRYKINVRFTSTVGEFRLRFDGQELRASVPHSAGARLRLPGHKSKLFGSGEHVLAL